MTRTAFEQGSVGVRAVQTPSTELDIGFSGSFGSAAADNDARRDSVACAANRRSPLVDRPTGASAGIGLAWIWL